MSDQRLRLALTLARRGGRLAAASRGRAQVSWKGPGDRVTEVDRAVQSLIVDEIHRQFPQDAVVAEEGAERVTIDREFVWAVDPLDGTNNFALGIPCFAVSIGILRAGLPYAGVVHDPNTRVTWWARHGDGAYEDDRALELKARPLTEASNIALRVPVDPELEPLIRDWLRHYKFRGFGSVALHLVYAAVGALDLVLDHKAKLWDIAAGAAILLEAGGAATDPGGCPLFPAPASAYGGDPIPILAGNRNAHAQALMRLPRGGRSDESGLVSARSPR